MKKLWTLCLVILVLTTPAFGKADESETMKGAKLEESKALPTVVVGANELAESIAEPGWPIIISAAMLSEDGSSIPVSDNLRIKLIDASEKNVQIKFDPVVRPQGDQETRFWIISESETTNLIPGNYVVTFEPVEGLVIQPADLEVTVVNPEHAASLDSLKIQKLLLLGQDDEALAEADRQTTSNAENADAWVAKGDILMGKDLPDEALKAYDKALEQHKETDSEPLFLQERRRAAFFRSLEKRGVITNSEDTQP